MNMFLLISTHDDENMTKNRFETEKIYLAQNYNNLCIKKNQT